MVAVKDTVGKWPGEFGVTEGLADDQYDDGAADGASTGPGLPLAILCCPPSPPAPQEGALLSATHPQHCLTPG